MAFETEKLVLANGALLRLGAKKIESFTEESDRALLCAQWTDTIRKETLRAHPWNFAIVRAFLNQFPQATLTPGALSGNGVTFTASASVFSAADIGYRLVATSNGQAIITSITDAQHAVGDIITPFTTLAAVAAEQWRVAPLFKWDFRYAKPSLYLRTVEVQGIGQLNISWNWWWARDSSPEPVATEGQFLVTDVGGKMNIAYIQDVEDPTLWDPNCRNAFEAR